MISDTTGERQHVAEMATAISRIRNKHANVLRNHAGIRNIVAHIQSTDMTARKQAKARYISKTSSDSMNQRQVKAYSESGTQTDIVEGPGGVSAETPDIIDIVDDEQHNAQPVEEVETEKSNDELWESIVADNDKNHQAELEEQAADYDAEVKELKQDRDDLKKKVEKLESSKLMVGKRLDRMVDLQGQVSANGKILEERVAQLEELLESEQASKKTAEAETEALARYMIEERQRSVDRTEVETNVERARAYVQRKLEDQYSSYRYELREKDEIIEKLERNFDHLMNVMPEAARQYKSHHVCADLAARLQIEQTRLGQALVNGQILEQEIAKLHEQQNINRWDHNEEIKAKHRLAGERDREIQQLKIKIKQISAQRNVDHESHLEAVQAKDHEIQELAAVLEHIQIKLTKTEETAEHYIGQCTKFTKANEESLDAVDLDMKATLELKTKQLVDTERERQQWQDQYIDLAQTSQAELAEAKFEISTLEDTVKRRENMLHSLEYAEDEKEQLSKVEGLHNAIDHLSKGIRTRDHDLKRLEADAIARNQKVKALMHENSTTAEEVSRWRSENNINLDENKQQEVVIEGLKQSIEELKDDKLRMDNLSLSEQFRWHVNLQTEEIDKLREELAIAIKQLGKYQEKERNIYFMKQYDASTEWSQDYYIKDLKTRCFAAEEAVTRLGGEKELFRTATAYDGTHSPLNCEKEVCAKCGRLPVNKGKQRAFEPEISADDDSRFF